MFSAICLEKKPNISLNFQINNKTIELKNLKILTLENNYTYQKYFSLNQLETSDLINWFNKISAFIINEIMERQ